MKANEALEKLRQNYKDDTHLFDDDLLDVIETALKDLERVYKKLNRLEKDCVELEHDRDTYRTAYRNELEIRNTNPNIKEALRVILTKRVNVKRFIEAKTFKDYNENLRESEQLTKYEFFNLKETIFVCVLSQELS